jgi:hypothetical protein
MPIYSFRVKVLGFSFNNTDGILRAFSQAGSQSITVFLADQPGLPIDQGQGPFGTGLDAGPAAIAFILINSDYFPDYFHSHLIHLPNLLNTLQHFPTFVTQAFTGFSAPFDAGRHVFLINIAATFAAFDAGLIRKNLHFASAIGAFMEGYFQVSSILTWAVTDHTFYLLMPFFISPNYILR